MRLTICSFEVPGYGGASTTAYALFQELQKAGANVAFINLVRETDAGLLQDIFGEEYGNPEKLDNVFTCHLAGRLFRTKHANLLSILQRLAPDIVLCCDYIASAIFLGQDYKIALVNYSSGCFQAQTYVRKGEVSDALDLLRFLEYEPHAPKLLPNKFEPYRNAEYDALLKSDLTVTHSPLIQKLLRAFYPRAIGKIYPEVLWKSEIILQSTRIHLSRLSPPVPQFSVREVDLLFVASNWQRIEKNYPLVTRLVEQLGEEHDIHIVGNFPYPLPNATHHGFITSHQELLQLMVNTKTLVCPSLIDAAPGVLWEASVCGCNIVASRNCGNWMICNPDLLVDPFTEARFIETIRHSLNVKIPDKIGLFQKRSLGDDLWQICQHVLLAADSEVIG